MGKLFGTDGVRGVANKELTGELAFKLGRAGGYYLSRSYQGRDKPVILLGKDTRISGDMLEAALTAGLTSAGIDVIKLGIIPTPGVAYLTGKREVQGGVMISASHNPVADNGIKFFNQKGYKLTDEMEAEIEDIIFNNYQDIPEPIGIRVGVVEENNELLNEYVNYLLTTVEVDFSGLKIVLDCANGAAFDVAPRVLKELGADVEVIHNSPDGGLINVNCGSTHPEVVASKVLEVGADLGIAHDGDADRVIMVDEKGQVVDGDRMMAICGLDLLKNGKLKGKTIVATPYSNLGLKEVLENAEAKLVLARNGDRYVLKEMLEHDYNLGGEKSGHIIFLDYNHTGDGVLTAIQLTQVIKKSGRKLSQLAEVMQSWPQLLNNIRVKEKDGWQENKKIVEMIKEAEKALDGEGRVFVRASGTEPLIRLMLEGKDEKLLKYWEHRLTEVISAELN